MLDTNILIYAFIGSMPQHTAARRWLEGVLAGDERIGIPWATLLGFLRLVTNRRAFSSPVPMAQAWRQTEIWLAHPHVWIPEPTIRHASLLGPLLATPGLRAEDVPDVHLAALAIEYGLILCSTDSGFARFDHLRWENPLRATPHVRERRGRYRIKSAR